VRYLDAEVVRAMEQAGCVDFDIGIESGVQRLLDVVRKGTTIPQIEEAIRRVKRVSRIQVSGLFILGLPGETPRDSRATIEFARSLPLDMAQFSLLTPYPGSPLFYDLVEQGCLDAGIRPGDDLDPDVWKRYTAYAGFTDKDPIWVTPTQTPGGLKRLQKQALRRFYFRLGPVLKQLQRLRLADLPVVVRAAWGTFF